MKKRNAWMMTAAMVCMIGASIPTAAEETKKIAIVPWDMAESFAVDFSHRAEEEIEAKGWEAVIMDPKGDWAQEYTILENLITQQASRLWDMTAYHPKEERMRRFAMMIMPEGRWRLRK